MKNFFKRIKNFYHLDLRWKLIKLGIYPKTFVNRSFFAKIYSRIILSFLLSHRYKKIKKKIFLKVFEKKIFKEKINSLFSLPRSGSMFVRCTLSSYNEIYHKIGDGVPKYDSINDKWIFVERPLLESDSWNLTDLEKYNLSIFNEERDKKYNNNVIFSRYPATRLDLFNIDELKPVILIRQPLDQIISLYNKHGKFKFGKNTNSKIDVELLSTCVNNYKLFLGFWSNYLKMKKKENYLIIRYNELLNDSYNTFFKMFSFFDIGIDENILKKSISINDTKETFERLRGIKINKIRFTDKIELDQIKKLIETTYFEDFKGEELEKSYNRFGINL